MSDVSPEPVADDSAQARPSRRAMLLLNPNARSGDACPEEVRDVMRAGGIDLFEPAEEDFCEAIKRHGRDCDLVVVGGGDGTISAVVGTLVATGLPLAILPLGTANDLARSLGLPTDPVEAARAIASHPARPMDVGTVNGIHFVNVASIGFSADLAHELTADLKRRWGVLGYAIAGYRLLRKARPFRVWIEHDGRRERVTTFQASVGNGKHYGGGMTVAHDARVDDGMLRFYSLEVKNWRRLIALLPALRRGTQAQAADVRAFPTREIVLHTRRPRAVNMDGDLKTKTPARIGILPGALMVHAPRTV